MKSILDMCCGSRMFWFDKQDDRAVFGDIRNEQHILCDGRTLEIKPDKIIDFRNLPFADESFHMVIFDPPHLKNVGDKSWMALKYGRLDSHSWRTDLAQGFSEAFRVLKPNGVLIFKWAEKDIPVCEILKLTPQKPVIGHRSGKASGTHWICFLKEEKQEALL